MRIQTVSAAIAAVADDIMAQGRVENSDSDAIANAMGQAEKMVAQQLAREGMSMKDALALAADAALKFGADSAESKELADGSIRNNGAPLPAPANDPSLAVPDAGPAAPDPDDAPVAMAAVGGADVLPVPVPQAMRRQAEPVAAPAIIVAPAEQDRRTYKVEMKKVGDVFSGAANVDLFGFKVPYVHWDGKHAEVPEIDKNYNMDLADLLTMLYAVSERRSTNIVGPHGCGKTEFVAQIAARLNFPLTVIPMDGQISRSELIGREKIRATANGNESYFRPGILPTALLEPGFLLFDEIDRAVSDVQYACHSVYLQKGITLLEDGRRFVPFHEHNRVFATANTKGRGSADGMYLAAEEMSEATRDRLSVWIEMDYQDPEEDAKVIKAKTKGISALNARLIADIAKSIRSAYIEQRLSQTCSLRQQLEVAHLSQFLISNCPDADKKDKLIGIALNRVILGRASAEDKGAIKEMIEVKLPGSLDTDSVFD